jgi:ribosome-associated protein
METTITLKEEFIKLDTLIKLVGVVGSGGQAKFLVQDGHVFVNGRQETQRGKKIRAGDVVEVRIVPGATIRVTRNPPKEPVSD